VLWQFGYILNIHLENNNMHGPKVYPTFDQWKARKSDFTGCFIKFLIIHTHYPPRCCLSWNSLIIVIFTTGMPFFRFYLNWTDPTTIKNNINHTCIKKFKISFLTASFIAGFKRCYGWTVGVKLSSIKILCVYNEGRIPLISAIVHPIVVLWTRDTHKSFSSSSPVKKEEIVTGSVEFTPKYAYLKCDCNSLCTSFDASCMDGVKDDVHLQALQSVASHT